MKKTDRHIALTHLDSGLVVSTVRLRRDPRAYETMMFQDGRWAIFDCETYDSAEDAQSGHERMVEKYREHSGCFRSERGRRVCKCAQCVNDVEVRDE